MFGLFGALNLGTRALATQRQGTEVDRQNIPNVNTPALVKDEDNFLAHIGDNGLLQARLETTEAQLRTRKDNLTQSTSNETDADLAETLMKLNSTQTAYQAALQTAGRLFDLSLMNYLR
jgi:flagellar hook-associated protein 3 FlgL